MIKSFRYALWFSGFLVLGYWIATTILAFTGCTPLARNWDKTVPGTCVDLINFFRWNGICNLLIDFLILCLPLPMVWSLRITMKQKLVLSSIFALGLLYALPSPLPFPLHKNIANPNPLPSTSVCVTSILRVLAYNPSQVIDGTYSTVGTVTWSAVEQGLGIVCACLPTVRPLFGFLYHNSSKSGTNKMPNGGGSGIGMDTFGSKSHHPAMASAANHKNMGTWGTIDEDSGSTVGFARLQDEEGILTPMEMQRSVYGGAGVGATGGGDAKVAGMGILKDTTIDRRSEIAR